MTGLNSNFILRQKNKLLWLFFLISFLLPNRGDARFYILIDQPSEKPFPIAVTSLIPQGKSIKEWNEKVSQTIQRDLELTGLFEIISPMHYPTSPEALSVNPATIQFSPWTLIGAQALITGSYTATDQGIKVSLNLYDPFLGQHLLGRNYQAKEKEMLVIAHHFADEVMHELTGERGVFSTQIAFVCAQGKKKEICAMDMDGNNIRQLTKQRSIGLSPAWSPDGKQVAYTLYQDGNPEIFVINSAGEAKPVTTNGSINLSPTFNPFGEITVASAMREDMEIFILNQRGKIVRQLTRSFGIDINPSWSPDGKQFVFASERSGKLHLFKARADGSGIRRLTYVGYHNDNPAWSPRGDKIVFQGRDQGVWDLFIMNADGSLLQRLTADSGNNESPSWSPNGRFITFTSTRNGTPQLFIMREDGSNQRGVGPKRGATQPSWSPWFD